MTITYRYLIATVVLFLVEVAIALYLHDDFIRPYFGDFLVVILIYCAVKSVFDIPVMKAAVAVLLFSYIIEVSQLLQLITFLGLQNSELARAVIGTGFSWFDIVAYTLGVGFIVAAEHIVNTKRRSAENI